MSVLGFLRRHRTMVRIGSIVGMSLFWGSCYLMLKNGAVSSSSPNRRARGAGGMAMGVDSAALRAQQDLAAQTTVDSAPLAGIVVPPPDASVEETTGIGAEATPGDQWILREPTLLFDASPQGLAFANSDVASARLLGRLDAGTVLQIVQKSVGNAPPVYLRLPPSVGYRRKGTWVEVRIAVDTTRGRLHGRGWVMGTHLLGVRDRAAAVAGADTTFRRTVDTLRQAEPVPPTAPAPQ